MIHSFLLIGQSNMAGRGDMDEVEPIINSQIKVLRNGRWQDMFCPINPDSMYSGVNLSESFADLYIKDHNVDVGLIPCAHGGTTIDQWCTGGVLYDHAVYQANLAQRTSTIAGILWHQGESDSNAEKYSLYKEKFSKVINNLRAELNLYDVPVLCGGLGDYLKTTPGCGYYHKINESIKEVVAENSMFGFVSAEGLSSKPDQLHFDSKSLREFGKRYYEKFVELEDRNKIFVEKPTMDRAINKRKIIIGE